MPRMTKQKSIEASHAALFAATTKKGSDHRESDESKEGVDGV
jgi:hypothetical protein